MKILFDNLMKLCDNPTEKAKFFYKDDITGMGTSVRIFSYHIANYSDWILPDALECRGIMFEMDGDKPVRIMSRPMEKFFNWAENPLVIGTDITESLFYMTKEDGSLISTFFDKGILGLKSKGSLYSDQVHKAAAWLNNHPALKQRLKEIAEDGITVNMEYIGPNNRIVINYGECSLRILNARNNKGEYIGMDVIFGDAILRPYMADVFDASVCTNEWIENVRKMENIEGYIIVFNDKMIKLKTDWYVTLHHTKDSINNNRRLVECCIENVTDDLRGLFFDDPVALQKISDFELMYQNTIHDYLNRILILIQSSSHLDRKNYAIKAQTEFKDIRFLFGVAMNAYLQQTTDNTISDINDVMKKNYHLLIPKKYQ